MTILERKVFISSNPRIVLSSCPPPCGHFSIQESATGGLSYKEIRAFVTLLIIIFLFVVNNYFVLLPQKKLSWHFLPRFLASFRKRFP